MSACGRNTDGRARRVRCDGCGRISSDPNGYYFDRKPGVSGYIRGYGWQCEHDFCDQCAEQKLSGPEYACPFDGDNWLNYIDPDDAESIRTEGDSEKTAGGTR